ncbi:pyridoxal-phosphate dependent enzyme [Streptomyces sp. NPDC053048]|uniref:pyridoxal-phosphate dependent enzyme n=1 Tax=Streptomyces sp. NPDC053048 TaxID=3365694 RepID=UPI0037CFB47D
MLNEPPARWYARSAPRTATAHPAAPAAVREFHASLPGYAPTRLAELPSLARELRVGRVFVKDESSRLGLPAFKALGASWAIHRALSERGGVSGPLTLVTATDGNHGRAVARMARLLGHRAHVFVSAGVHPGAADAIAAEGALVTRVDGPYDDAVRHAAALADGATDALLVQDTAWPGYERVPGWIVEGYSTLFREIDDQLAAAGAPRPDVVAVPIGVGSLAQAAVTHYAGPFGPAPTLLGVEPVGSACVLSSLLRGERTSVPTGPTIMAGLNCGTPSTLAWPLLHEGLTAAVAVTDEQSARAGHALAALGVSSGPCGAASLAGVRAAVRTEDRRTALGLRPDATIVLLSTEGTAANPHHRGP